jgi:glycosyltransferase involved in cell wall biosynthesis
VNARSPRDANFLDAIQIVIHIAGWMMSSRRATVVAMRRNRTSLFAIVHPDAPALKFAGSDAATLQQRPVQAQLFFVEKDGSTTPIITLSSFFSTLAGKIIRRLVRANRLRSASPDPAVCAARGEDFFRLLAAASSSPALIGGLAQGVSTGRGAPGSAPFGLSDHLPAFVPRRNHRRSVLFVQPAYYNYYYLARALRARDWDAISLCTEAPDSPHRKFYHGEDINIFHPDPLEHRRLLSEFFAESADRFDIIHTYGVGILSLFAGNHDTDNAFDAIPWDILEWRRRGTLVGYSHSGCLDGVSQTAFRAWSPTMCANCVWRNRPDVCSDSRNLAWGRKVTSLVDLFCAETEPPLDYKSSPNVFRAPLTYALDPDIWHPDLAVPDRLKRPRKPGEVVVYCALGNRSTRSKDGRNAKGTSAVEAAIDQLRSEGIDIRLDFVHDVPSIDNRFVQVQADIIVDQLHYGRYGALAREGMMLGKPVVGRVNKDDGGSPATQCILETPIVHADETSVVDVLRDLALNPSKRAEIGQASREHAIKWWSADRLAERFEQVYDHVRKYGRIPPEEEIL